MQVSEEIAMMSRVLNDSGAQQLRVSSGNEQERLKLWSGHKTPSPRGTLISIITVSTAFIPRQHLAAVLSITGDGKKYELRCANVCLSRW